MSSDAEHDRRRRRRPVESAARRRASRFVPGPAITMAGGRSSRAHPPPGEGGDEVVDVDGADRRRTDERRPSSVTCAERGRSARRSRRAKASTSPGATSTTNRPIDSLNSAVARSACGQRVDGGAEAAADAHLGEGDRQPALADVVARRGRARRGSPVEPPVALPARRDRAPAPSRRRRPAHRAPCRGGSRRTRLACAPTRNSTLPPSSRSGVTHASASGTWATAVITSVGGTAWRWPSLPRYSLFSESLPETNGAR